jgi:predicted DNA-binding transcriptional regulator YafY
MGAYVRIHWLHEQLINSQYPNANTIARVFEISHRQGQRDIEYLRDSLGAPIEYIHVKKSYRYQQSFVLPTYFIDEQDKAILKRLSDYYDELTEIGLDHYLGYSELLKRLSGSRIESEGKPKPVTPYRAVVDFMEGRTRFSLLERYCVQELPDNRRVYEFLHPEIFIGLLFACGAKLRIVEPIWLRERLSSSATNILETNT